MDMKTKNYTNHLRVRLTETQFKSLINKVIEEEKTKSRLVRDIINDYTKQENEKK